MTFHGSAEELLWATVDYYFADPDRCSVDYTVDGDVNKCVYRGSNGKACAIGRFLPDDVAIYSDTRGVLGGHRDFDEYFPHVSPGARAAIQTIHDHLAFLEEEHALALVQAVATMLACNGGVNVDHYRELAQSIQVPCLGEVVTA